MSDPLPSLEVSYPQPTKDTPGWPFVTGYAAVDDVVSRINAATWDPDSPTATVTEVHVSAYLCDATAMLDAALAKRGYWVPLRVTPGWKVPPGTPLYAGVGVGAWNILRAVAAAYGTALVEQSRHGSVGTANLDPNAQWWLQFWNDFLAKIVDGSDNLTAFGVGGDFPPELNPYGDLGALGFVQSGSVAHLPPFFTRYQDLGSGWEYGGIGLGNRMFVSGDREPPPVDVEPDEEIEIEEEVP